MKKFLSTLLIFCLLLSALTCVGCTPQENYRINIVCTIFPLYDWIKNITANIEGINVTMLLDSGVDLHSYQPTVKDIAQISTCDLFVFVGGESDEWTDDALKNAVNKNLVAINLLETLGDNVKEEEVIEGMQTEVHEEEHEEETEYDEHVWLSLKNAQICCNEIADCLSKIDSENAELFLQNFANYKAKLTALDLRYQQAVANANKSTVVFGDRFPFRYLVDDYGLSYFAAFVGCSAESEASFETIVFLSGKVDELGLKAVLTTESNNNGIAQTIVNNTKNKNQTVLAMNSMQSVTAKTVKNGADYLNIMEENLDVLTQALD